MELCLSNIQGLISDADLLIAENRSARAYFLLHTATEEISKFFILEATGRKLVNSLSVDWKRLWQRLRSHASKMAHAELRFVTGRLEAKNIELAGLALLTEHALGPRNAALYVEVDPQGIFRAPNEIQWDAPAEALRATAHRLLAYAQATGGTAYEIEASFHRTIDLAEAKEILRLAIERIRHIEIPKEELCKILINLKNHPT